MPGKQIAATVCETPDRIANRIGDTTLTFMREAAVATTGLAKHFGSAGRLVKAVDGIDLHVAAGDIYALLGLNGAGKTTAMRMLLGMVSPTAGEAYLFGTSVRRATAQVWARTGYLVETPAAYPDLTVTENLIVAARLRRLSNRDLSGGDPIGDIVDRLGLSEYAHRKARDLSLGNAQRLGLAKALIHRPDLLILDEPANGLDPAGVVEIRRLLQHLAGQGTAILVSSHILGEVARLATRIGIIHQGHIITELAASEVDSHVRQWLHVNARDLAGAERVLRHHGFRPYPRADGLALTEPAAIDRPEQVAALLAGSGHPPTHLAVKREDLETLFLRLVGQPAEPVVFMSEAP